MIALLQTKEGYGNMLTVKWRNTWNWSSAEGGTTRLHLTKDTTLSGITLCGREYPRCKGYPTAIRYCKTCIKKSKLSYEEIRTLDSVANSED